MCVDFQMRKIDKLESISLFKALFYYYVINVIQYEGNVVKSPFYFGSLHFHPNFHTVNYRLMNESVRQC